MAEILEASREAHAGEHRKTVSITIDGTSHDIRPGEHSGKELKGVGHVPADYELDEVVQGKFVPVPDDKKVHIKGGEVFVSHPKDAASS